MKSEPYTSECLLSFASETTKAATSAPRHLLINCGRLLPRILCRPSPWIFRSCHFQPFFQSLWKTALWSRGNVECASIDCQQEQVSLPGNSQHRSVVDQGSSSFQANSVLCFLTEMLPLEGASVVGQLCIFHSFKLMWLRCSAFVLDTGKAANAQECFLPSLRPGRKFAFKVERKCRNFLSPSPKPSAAAAMFHPCCQMSHGICLRSFSLHFFSELTLFPPSSFSPLSSFSLSHAKGEQWTE